MYIVVAFTDSTLILVDNKLVWFPLYLIWISFVKLLLDSFLEQLPNAMRNLSSPKNEKGIHHGQKQWDL